MTILSSNDKITTLNTGLDSTKYARTANLINFTENGCLAIADNLDSDFSFSPWQFTQVREESAEDKIYFDGNGFGGQTVLDIIEGTDKDLKARMVYAFFHCLSQALLYNAKLNAVGPGGILYKETFNHRSNKVAVQFLFLPAQIYDQCALFHNEEDYAHLQGFWQNKNLTDTNALLFLKAVVLYKALSGYYPFPNINTHDRQQDITDRHFVPLEDKVNGINDKLAFNINWCFGISNESAHKDDGINASTLKAELGLTDDFKYSEPVRQKAMDDREFEHRAASRKKAEDAKIKRKRAIRRNTAGIIIALVFFSFATNISYKRHMENLEKPSTVGIGPFDLIQTFYSGFHQINAPLMQITAKGRQVQGTIDMISNVHVTNQTRGSYKSAETALTPELWFYRSELMSNWFFGITEFSIDDVPAYNRYSPPPKKYKLPKATFEDGTEIPQGTTSVHNVKYNLVYTAGLDTPITVDACKAQVTCTFRGERWYITDIQVDHDTKDYDKEKIITEYQNLKFTKYSDPIELVDSLRNQYPWLPDHKSMENAAADAYKQAHFFD